jgi:hypothetical protein
MFNSAAWRLGPLSLTVLLFAGCRKTDVVPPTTGGLIGTIVPTGGAQRVTVHSISTRQLYQLEPAATGGFAWSDLPAGTYALDLLPAAGYQAPAPRTLTVVAGRTTEAGSISLVPTPVPPRGVVSWEADGVLQTAAVVAGSVNVARQQFLLMANSYRGNRTDRILLELLGQFDGRGTYQPAAKTPVGLRYESVVAGVPVAWYGGEAPPESTGVLTVTDFHPRADSVKGKFEFVALGTGGTPGRVRITNGRFALRL